MNHFALAARRAKVLELIRFIPLADTAAGHAAVATTLASWGQPDRDRFAAAHRVRSPSETTWKDLCDAVRARRVAS